MSAVRIDLQVGGVSEVRTAFRSIEQEVARAQKAMGKTGDGGTAAIRRSTNEQKKAWQQTGREAEKAVREQEKAQQRIAKEVERTAAKISRAEKKSADDQIREAARVETAKTREARKGATERERMQKRIVSERFKDLQREADLEQRSAIQSSRNFRQGALRRVGSTLSGAATTAGRLAMGALSFNGAVNASDAIRDRMGLEDSARATANSAYMPEVKDANGKVVQAAGQRFDYKDIMSKSREVEAATNMKAGDVSEAMGKYIELSSDTSIIGKNKDGSSNNMIMDLAKLAKGQGADMTDVMKTAGFLQVQNKDLTPDKMMDLMRGIVGQGKLGAVSLADLAHVAPRLTASAAMYQGDQAHNQQNLLGMAQIAIKAGGTAPVAATAVANMGSDTLSHQEALKHLVGKKTFASLINNKGQIADPAMLMAETLDAAKGDQSKLMTVFKARSMRVVQPLAQIYNDAEADKKGSGKQAVLDEVRKNTGATYTKEETETDFANRMASTSEKFESTILKLKELLADQLFPAFERISNKLPDFEKNIVPVIEQLGSLADFLMAHPFAGIGMAAAAAVSKDIAAAAIGNVIKNLLNGSGGGGGGGGGLGKILGGVGIVATVAAAAYGGKEALDAHLADRDQRNGGYAMAGAGAAGYAARLARGASDPETIKAAQAEADKLRATIDDQKAHRGPDGLDKAAAFLGRNFDPADVSGLGGAAKQNQTAKDKAIADNIAQYNALTAALKAATAAAASNAAANRSAPLTHASRGGPGT